MWTITVTAATLVTLVGAVTSSSVELDKYRYHSTAVFLLYAVSRMDQHGFPNGFPRAAPRGV